MAFERDDIIEHSPKRAILLRNVNCVYCGRLFGDDLASTKEHVIGRRFVPKGAFDGQWNLIVKACLKCNGDKADLEDDISAISMLPDLLGKFVSDDPRLAAEASRKAPNALSRRSKKPVAESREHFEIKQSFGAATFTFNFTAPPQVDDKRLYELAYFHFQAFFFLITYREDTRRGGFVRGGFYPIGAVRRADWGNPQMRWFGKLVRDWDLRIHAIGADSFFKMIIRRHPGGKEVWAWALEWNHSIRVVGFAGNEEDVRGVVETLPPIAFDVVQEEQSQSIRMRVDQSLSEEDDDLFAVELGSSADGAESGAEKPQL